MSESKKKRAKKEEINYNHQSPFPVRFTSLLRSSNTKQDTLAKYVGATRQSISQWSRGDTKPDIYYLGKIADYFEVSTDYLLGRTKEKTTNEDIKTVVQTTGLSEKAVDTIRKYYGYPVYCSLIQILNFFIESDDFWHILKLIYECKCGDFIYTRQEKSDDNVTKFSYFSDEESDYSKEVCELFSTQALSRLLKSILNDKDGETK